MRTEEIQALRNRAEEIRQHNLKEQEEAYKYYLKHRDEDDGKNLVDNSIMEELLSKALK